MADDKTYNILASIRASASEFNSDIKAIQRDSKELEKSLKGAMDMAKSIGTGLSAAGAAITGSMLAATKVAVDYGDTINDLRQKTGASTETISKLGFAAEQSGSSMGGLATGLKFLARNMEAALDGSKKQAQAFADLGISSKALADAHGNVEKIMGLVADRFVGMEDGAEKTALAMGVFGKSGADLIPLLNEGSAGIQKLGQDATDAGLVIGQDFAAASDELNDTLNKLKASAMGVSIGIASALMPAIQSVATAAAAAGAYLAQFAKDHETLTKAIFLVGAALVGAGGLLLGIVAVGAVIGPFMAGIAALGVAFTAVTGAVGGLTLLLPALLGQVSLIGGALVAATAAVVAIGAAIGILIGSFINWAIAGTRVEKALDSVTTRILSYEKYAGQMIDTTTKASAVLKDKYGVAIDKNNKSIEEWNKQVTEALRQQTGLDSKLQANIVTLGKESTAHKILYEELERSLPIWQRQQEAKDAAEASSKALTESIKALKASFTDDQGESVFIQALYEINRSGGLTGTVIDRMKESLDKYKNSTDPLIQTLRDQIRAEDDLKYSMDLRVKVMQDAEARLVEQARLQRVMNSAYAEAKPLMDAYDQSQRETNRLMAEMAAATDEILIPLTDYEKLLGPIKNQTDDVAHATDEAAQAVNEYSRAWETAMGNVTSGLAKGLADAILSAKSFKDSLINIAKQAADGMLTAFFAGLLDPLTKELGKLGKKIGDILTGTASAGGAAGSAGGGAAGGVAGGIALAALLNPITLFFLANSMQKPRPIENVGPDPAHNNYAFPGHDLEGNFIGDSQEYIDAQQAVVDALEAATKAALDNAAATEAEANANRLADVETELADVRAKLGDAMIQKMGMIDTAIESSSKNIDDWTQQVVDLTDNIDANTQKLNDASYWTKRYTDLISESANELKRVTDERSSIEQQIADLTYRTEHDRLEDIIAAGGSAENVAEATRQLAELEAVQHRSEVQARIDELAALKVRLVEVIAQQAAAQKAYEDASAAAQQTVSDEQQALAAQIAADIATRTSIEENIDAEYEHVEALNAQKVALQAIMDTLGVTRQTELDKVNATIQSLIDRGAALETERANLASLLDVASSTTDIFNGLGDAFRGLTSGVGVVDPLVTSSASTEAQSMMGVLNRIADGIEKGGDVYMDKEAVGRALVPAINRLVTFDRMELTT